MGDLKGISRLAKDFAENEEYKTMIKHLQAGTLTVRDWKEQLSNLQKMGQLGSIMQMIGLNQPMFQGMNIEKKFKGYMVILDSMTDRELDGPAKGMLGDESRLKRLAHGSGRDIREVSELFEQIKMFQQCIDRLPKAMRQQLSNPNAQGNEAQMMAQVQRMLPKGVSQAQLQQMMRQMGAAGLTKRGKK